MDICCLHSPVCQLFVFSDQHTWTSRVPRARASACRPYAATRAAIGSAYACECKCNAARCSGLRIKCVKCANWRMHPYELSVRRRRIYIYYADSRARARAQVGSAAIMRYDMHALARTRAPAQHSRTITLMDDTHPVCVQHITCSKPVRHSLIAF